MVKGFTSSLGGLGTIVGFGAITAGLKSTASGMDSILKSAETLGIGVENFIALKHAANMADISMETLTGSLFKMEDSLATAAASGKGPAVDALNKIGLSARELVNMSPDAAFGAIADGLNSIGNVSERNSIAMDIFGKSAREIMVLLKEGSAGVAKAADETKRLGMTFSKIDAQKVDAAGDAVHMLTESVKGAFQAITIELTPVVESFATKAAFSFASAAKSVGHFWTEAKAELGFFVGTWDIQWKIIKLRTFMTLDAIGAFTMASFDGTITGLKNFAGNWQNIFKDIARITVNALDSIVRSNIAAFSGIGAIFQNLGSIIAGDANPFTVFKDQFAATMRDIPRILPEVFADSKGALGSLGMEIGKEFSRSFESRIDKDLLKQLNVALDALGESRLEFDKMRKDEADAAAKAAAQKVGKFEPRVKSGPSGKTAGAAQLFSPEAASMIVASIMSGRGGDDSQRLLKQDVDANQRTAAGVEQLAKRDPIKFNVINSFV